MAKAALIHAKCALLKGKQLNCAQSLALANPAEQGFSFFVNLTIMKHTLSLLFFLLMFGGLQAQSITGTWKTIDDETNEAKSHLDLFMGDGKLYGKVSKLLKSSPDKLCDKCPGERKNQPILGMIVLVDMKEKEGYWQSGSILDPEKGKWYNCKIWLKNGDPNTLVVRGYIGPFYRTQYWYRV